MFSFADLTQAAQKAAESAVQAAQNAAESAVASASVFSLDNLQEDGQPAPSTTATADGTEMSETKDAADDWNWKDEEADESSASAVDTQLPSRNTKELESHATIESECKVLRQLVETLKTEVYSLKEENVKLSQEASLHSKKYADIEASYRECQKTLDDERKASISQQTAAAEAQAQTQAQMLESVEKTKKSETQLAEALASIEDLKLQLASASDGAGETGSMLKLLESQVASANEKIESLKTDLEQATARARDYELKARKASSEYATVNEKSETLKAEVSRLEAQLKILQEAPADKSGGGKKKDKFRDLLQASEETRKSLEQKMEIMAASLRSSQGRVEELERADMGAKELVQSLQDQLSEQGKDRVDIEKRLNETEGALKDATMKISEQESTSSKGLTDLSLTVDYIRFEIDGIIKGYNISSDSARPEKRSAKSVSQCDALPSAIQANLEGSLTDIDDALFGLTIKYCGLRDENKATRTTLDEFTKSVQESTTVITALRTKNSEDKERIEELNKLLLEANTALIHANTTASSKESAAIALLASQLEEAKKESTGKDKIIEETKEQCKQKVKDALIKFAESKKKFEEEIATLQENAKSLQSKVSFVTCVMKRCLTIFFLLKYIKIRMQNLFLYA